MATVRVTGRVTACFLESAVFTLMSNVPAFVGLPVSI